MVGVDLLETQRDGRQVLGFLAVQLAVLVGVSAAESRFAAFTRGDWSGDSTLEFGTTGLRPEKKLRQVGTTGLRPEIFSRKNAAKLGKKKTPHFSSRIQNTKKIIDSRSLRRSFLDSFFKYCCPFLHHNEI